MEDLLVKKIENGIRAIRLGIKTPFALSLSTEFDKLKLLNIGLHNDLLNKYKNVISDSNKKNKILSCIDSFYL